MAWIESHQDILHHPKTKRLARRLGIDVPATIGHLHILWWWALAYSDDGDLSAYDEGELADAMLWTGDPGQLVAALVDTGWLDQDGDRLAVHDWDEYVGKLLDQRRRNAEKQARWRAEHRGKSPPEGPPNGHVTDPDQIRNESVTVTSPTRNRATVPYQPNQTKPTEPDQSVSRALGPAVTEQAESICADFPWITQHLLVAGSEDDVDLVAQAIVDAPSHAHRTIARQVRRRYGGSWHSMTSAQRAVIYADKVQQKEQWRQIDQGKGPVGATSRGRPALSIVGEHPHGPIGDWAPLPPSGCEPWDAARSYAREQAYHKPGEGWAEATTHDIGCLTAAHQDGRELTILCESPEHADYLEREIWGRWLRRALNGAPGGPYSLRFTAPEEAAS